MTDKRGDVRWFRKAPVLALHWIDSKPVSILSTIHLGNCEVKCERRTKRNGKYEKVKTPSHLLLMTTTTASG